MIEIRYISLMSQCIRMLVWWVRALVSVSYYSSAEDL
jgi:hypothetical protein